VSLEPRLTNAAYYSSDGCLFRRLPGLYRRWELTEVCEPNRNYQIEDAGADADGTPLLAIYVAEPAPDVREAA
jgi:hypothetical protein